MVIQDGEAWVVFDFGIFFGAQKLTDIILTVSLCWNLQQIRYCMTNYEAKPSGHKLLVQKGEDQINLLYSNNLKLKIKWIHWSEIYCHQLKKVSSDFQHFLLVSLGIAIAWANWHSKARPSKLRLGNCHEVSFGQFVYQVTTMFTATLLLLNSIYINLMRREQFSPSNLIHSHCFLSWAMSVSYYKSLRVGRPAHS